MDQEVDPGEVLVGLFAFYPLGHFELKPLSAQALMDCKQTPYVQTRAMAANIQPHVARHPEV